MPLKVNESFLGRQVVLPVQVSVHVKIKVNYSFRLGTNLSSCIHQINGMFLLVQDLCSCC